MQILSWNFQSYESCQFYQSLRSNTFVPAEGLTFVATATPCILIPAEKTVR